MRPIMPIADALLEVMRENDMTSIDIGDYGILDDAYDRAYGSSGSGQRTRNPHPMNRHQAVMDAVRRSAKFKRVGSIRHCYGSGQERLHPFYRPVAATSGETPSTSHTGGSHG